LTLAGSASGLFPGASITLVITVQNPLPYSVTVNTADVTVQDANAGCLAANLSAQGFIGSTNIASNAEAGIPVTLHLMATAPDACQAATFPLEFSATGVAGPASGPTSADPLGSLPFTGIGGGTLALTLFGLSALTIGILTLIVRSRLPRREPCQR